MANKMLIDASHPEETRVVVVRGNKVEEFDFESASRRQLRGNIYLAKVIRVEPSLQAAFVDYGGNRHGFLAFSEIHPDYYQIPVADRQALLEEEARHERDAERDEDRAAHRRGRRRGPAQKAQDHDDRVSSEPVEAESHDAEPVQAPVPEQDDHTPAAEHAEVAADRGDSQEGAFEAHASESNESSEPAHDDVGTATAEE